MVQTKVIDGLLLRDMVLAGAALLEKNREAVDALNVFPVPDGDTGTNMSLTMASATKELSSKEFLSAGEAAEALGPAGGFQAAAGEEKPGALRGAAGTLRPLATLSAPMTRSTRPCVSSARIRAATSPNEDKVSR